MFCQILYPPFITYKQTKHKQIQDTDCTVAHLKKAVILVCLFTLETLLEAWDTTAEGAAPAPSAPVTYEKAKGGEGEGDSETPK